MDKSDRSIQQGRDIPQLTGVRAVAALMVFAFHGRIEIAAHFPFAAELLGQAFVGVNVFFVLSGFLIYWRYAPSAALEGKWLANYFRSRAARIYPLTFLLTLLALWWMKTSEPLVWIRCLTLTQGLTPDMLYRGIPQAWTLTVEECFYFAAPILMILCRGRGLILRLAAMTVVFWTVGLCIYGPTRFMVQNTIFGRCFEFFLGMALAGALVGPNSGSTRPLPFLTIAGIAGLIGSMHLMAVCDRRELPLIYWTVADNFLLPVAVAICFYGLIHERGPIRAFLASRPMIFFGKVSFAFYLVHFGVFSELIARLGYGLCVDFLLLLLVSTILYLAIEEPLRKLLRGKRPARLS
jgi:peptidoglycan/LPS O-acetylase OafA/YrhL